VPDAERRKTFPRTSGAFRYYRRQIPALRLPC